MTTSVCFEKQLDLSKSCSYTHTIIGAIYCSSVIFVAMINPPPTKLKVQESQTTKTTKPKKKNIVRRKVQRYGDIIIEKITVVYVDIEESSTSENKKPITKDTIIAHFVKFLNENLDIMDTDKRFVDSYLVMDNCTIYKSHLMLGNTESGGY